MSEGRIHCTRSGASGRVVSEAAAGGYVPRMVRSLLRLLARTLYWTDRSTALLSFSGKILFVMAKEENT